MARAGGGSGHSGGGGSHSFSGGHSSGSRSGGHVYGSSSGGSRRAGGSSSSSSYRNSGSYRSSPRYYGGYRYGYRSYMPMNLASVMLVILFVFIAMMTTSSKPSVKSTIQRDKIDNSNRYVTSNIIDELGYFDSLKEGSTQMKEFFDETGIQPYVYIKDYDPQLTTNSEKEAWASNWYDTEIADEYGFAFVYFANADEHSNIAASDKSVGYMCYVAGVATGTVMDDEAVNIFWSYIDKYWVSDLSMEDMVGQVFSGTADSIMKVSKTTGQMLMIVVIVTLVAVALFEVYMIIKKQAASKKEQAEMTEKILNSPIEKFGDSSDEVNKYL